MQFRKTGLAPSLVTRLFRPWGVRQAAILICLCVVHISRLCWAAKVSVSGATALVGLQVLASPDQLQVSGILQDDARQPVPAVPLQVSLSGHPAELRFYSCTGGVAAERALESDGEPNTALLETDRLGRFCVALDKAAQGAQLAIHFAGAEHWLPSETSLSLAPRANQVVLAFSANELRVALDRPPLIIQVDTRTAQPAAPRSVPVTLWRTDLRAPQQLGEAVPAVIGQPAFFAVTADQLGAPGLGELRARVESDAQSGAYEAVAKLTKTGSVELELQGAVELLQPSGAWQFTVLARANPAGPVQGLVEVRRGGAPVTVVPVTDDGRATLKLDAKMLGAAQQLTASFVASEPWWRSPGALSIALPPAPRSVARSAPWWTVSLLVVAFFVWRAWQRPIRGPRRQPSSKVSKNVPQVIVISDASEQRSWSGLVLDADDDRPVPNARVELRSVSFAESRVIADATTDPAGGFAFPDGVVISTPVTLSVTAAEHRPLEQRLERPARVAVRLRQRRRALISELVNWASLHRLGLRRPGVDPTPGQIAHSAHREGREGASWAQSIEHAAFGDSPVDEQRDGTLRQQRPDPVREDPAREDPTHEN